RYATLRCLPSSPTRRSSDLLHHVVEIADVARRHQKAVLGVALVLRKAAPLVVAEDGEPTSLDARHVALVVVQAQVEVLVAQRREDRKSTRLNSSHVTNSYAV